MNYLLILPLTELSEIAEKGGLVALTKTTILWFNIIIQESQLALFAKA